MAKKDLLKDTGNMTVEVKKEEKKYTGPMVQIRPLPELDNSGEEGLLIDQYEHVTLANETGEESYKVRRGEAVEVPVPVFMALYEKYGKKV